MTTTPDWTSVLDDAGRGRVDGARRRGGAPRTTCSDRVAGVLASGELPGPTAEHLADEVAFAWPDERRRGALGRRRRHAAAAHARHAHAWTASRARWSCRRTTPATARCRTASPRRSARRSRPPATRRRASSRRSRRSPPAPAWPATGATTSPTCPALGSYLMLAACATDAPPPRGRRLGRAAAAGPLRALQRLPARLPQRRHPRRQVPPADRPLPHHGERGRGAVPRLGRPGLAPLRRRLPALPAGLPGERRRRAPRRAGGGRSTSAETAADPGGDAGRRSSPPPPARSSSAAASTTRRTLIARNLHALLGV